MVWGMNEAFLVNLMQYKDTDFLTESSWLIRMLKSFISFQGGKYPFSSWLRSSSRNIRGWKETRTVLPSPRQEVHTRRSFHSSSILYKKNRALPSGVIEEGEEEFIIRSPYPDVDIPEQNVADFVFANVDHYGDLPALCCGMTGRQYTYEMCRDNAVKFGSALRRLGAKKSDVVAFLLPNIPEFPIAFLGCVGAGLTVTTINPTYKAEEIARQLENSGAKYIVTIGTTLQTLLALCNYSLLFSKS